MSKNEKFQPHSGFELNDDALNTVAGGYNPNLAWLTCPKMRQPVHIRY